MSLAIPRPESVRRPAEWAWPRPLDLELPPRSTAPPVRVVQVATVGQTFEFFRRQADVLRKHGFDVHAVASPGPALERFGRREGIAVHGVEMPRRITPIGDLRALSRLVELFRRLRPRIVHAHTPKGGLLGMIAAAIAGVPGRIYTIHGLPLETARGPRRFLLHLTERVSSLLATRVHAVSPSLRQRALEEGISAPWKIQVLGKGTVNGVDAEGRFRPGPEFRAAGRALRRRLGIPPDALVVGFVGRLVRDKGIPELVEAWRELRTRYQNLELLVVGPFEPQDPVPWEDRRLLGSDPRVHLTGPVDSTFEYYAAMDVVALPTHREGFPQVPLEAAALERPVVASRATGCVDAVVDGKTGLLVPVGNGKALAGALEVYLRNPELRREHGRAARERVLADFRPSDRWRSLLEEYRPWASEVRPMRPPAARDTRPRPPLRRPLDLFLKRLIDMGAAALGLVLLSPLLLVLALAVRSRLGRPLLFRQLRPGRQGRPFTLVKFRTMREGTGPDEVRLTPFGRFLRSTSLDELPQLWNVLKGDMSLVGPRPLRMEYLGRYRPHEARRHEATPGLTGWVQVNGRNSLTWDEKFAGDLWYVEHGSLRVDLRILLRTLGQVLSRRGIDAPGGGAMPEFMGQEGEAPK